MEKGVITSQPVFSIGSAVFSGNHYRRIVEYEGKLGISWTYDGNPFKAEYQVAYARSFKERNGTPAEELHDFRVDVPVDLYQLPLLKEFPHQAIPIVIEKSVVKKPEGRKELIVTDLSDWLVAALREKLPHRVRKGLDACIKGL